MVGEGDEAVGRGMASLEPWLRGEASFCTKFTGFISLLLSGMALLSPLSLLEKAVHAC